MPVVTVISIRRNGLAWIAVPCSVIVRSLHHALLLFLFASAAAHFPLATFDIFRSVVCWLLYDALLLLHFASVCCLLYRSLLCW